MRRIFLGAAFFLLAGCATHYYTIGDDRVNLFLKIPKARVVYFASSLDQYKFHPAKKMDGGIWEITAPSAHEFRYFYIVDGVVYLPDCKLKEKDDFSAENCIFVPDM